MSTSKGGKLAPKAQRMTYCHYARRWISLGRARSRCPSCGAALASGSTHPVEMRRAEGGTA